MFEGKQISAVRESLNLCKSKPNASYTVIKELNLQQTAHYMPYIRSYNLTAVEYAAIQLL